MELLPDTTQEISTYTQCLYFDGRENSSEDDMIEKYRAEIPCRNIIGRESLRLLSKLKYLSSVPELR